MRVAFLTVTPNNPLVELLLPVLGIPSSAVLRDCSPGHARKEGLHVAKTGASRGFSLSAAPVWGFSRGMKGSSGSLSCGAREVRAS